MSLYPLEFAAIIMFVTFFRALFIAVLLLNSAVQAATSGADKIVLIGGDYNYPPYEFLDDDGKPSG